MTGTLESGAIPSGSGTLFRVWAPIAHHVDVRLFSDRQRATASLNMRPVGRGWYESHVEGVRPGALYEFVVDGRPLPDPYARFLPFGVHGPAEVVERPPPAQLERTATLEGAVIYELHIGTFTPAGTYDGARQRLPHVAELGATTIELLPVSAFPGRHGWGYDGVAHFAPFAPYGRPEDLRALIDAAHRLGLTVILDVVYNHFGPQGNYLGEYAPAYFRSAGDSPWGGAPNLAEPMMRRYVLDNARMWLSDYGFDGLRLDATHALIDESHPDILSELSATAHALEPPRLVIAEDDRNEPALLTERGIDAVWADDFHHQMHVVLTREHDGYYAAYEPNVEDLARTIERGWLYEGQHYEPWGRPRGKPAGAVRRERLVYCVQNHDQIGNRALGTRLASDAGSDAQLAATLVMLFLPATPLLFMGQEWGASSPFLFFSDHEPEFGRLVSEGRRKEFSRFQAFADPAEAARIPDPQAISTFERSKLDWNELDAAAHRAVLAEVRAMLKLRREDPVLRAPTAGANLRASARGSLLIVERHGGGAARTMLANLSEHPVAIRPAGKPMFCVGKMTAERLGAYAVAIWAGGRPTW
jgi:maltooligosyltrehalose trehalohydrolase